MGLHELDSMQLKDISSRINLLTKSSTKIHDGKSNFGARVLQSICDVMRKHNVETPSVATLKKSAAYASARAKFDDLQIFFDKISKSRIIQDAILNEAVQLLYFDLVNWQGVAISSHTLLNQVHRIPATLNRHFPGYAISGTLTKIVERK